MRIQFELAEVLFVIASVMFISSINTIGWVFFSIALISAILRFGIRQAEKIEENKKREKLDSDLKDLLVAHQNPVSESRTYPKIVH